MPRRTMSSSVAIAPARSPDWRCIEASWPCAAENDGMVVEDGANGGHRLGARARVECFYRAVEVVGHGDQRLRIVGAGEHANARVSARCDVTERLEPLARIRAERRLFGGGAARLQRRGDAAQQRLERARPLAVAREQVDGFVRIRSQVVELGVRQIDQLVVACRHGGERCPVAGEVGVHRLQVCRCFARPLGHRRNDGTALEFRRRGDADQIERGRGEVDQPHEAIECGSGPNPEPRTPNPR